MHPCSSHVINNLFCMYFILSNIHYNFIIFKKKKKIILRKVVLLKKKGILKDCLSIYKMFSSNIILINKLNKKQIMNLKILFKSYWK